MSGHEGGPSAWKGLGTWLLATALLVLCFRGVDLVALVRIAGQARPGWLAVALAANGAILLLWAAQWRLFLPRGRPVAWPKLFGLTAVMATVANSVPFLAGQATGVHLLATRGGTGHATALSVAALDQLAEGCAKVAMLLALAAAAPLPPALRRTLFVLATGVAALLAVVLAAAWSHGRMRLPGSRDGRGGRALAFLSEWAAGLEGARRPTVLGGGVLLALAMKAAELGGILAVQSALGVGLPAWSGLPVLAAVSLSTMVSVSPANLGVYEGSAFLAYRALGMEAEVALGLAVLQHVAYLVPMAGVGWGVMAQAARGAEAPERARS